VEKQAAEKQASKQWGGAAEKPLRSSMIEPGNRKISEGAGREVKKEILVFPYQAR